MLFNAQKRDNLVKTATILLLSAGFLNKYTFAVIPEGMQVFRRYCASGVIVKLKLVAYLQAFTDTPQQYST